jgi:hypothetical protein
VPHRSSFRSELADRGAHVLVDEAVPGRRPVYRRIDSNRCNIVLAARAAHGLKRHFCIVGDPGGTHTERKSRAVLHDAPSEGACSTWVESNKHHHDPPPKSWTL